MDENFTIMIHKLLYTLGSSIRNPSLRKHLAFLEKTHYWSKKELEDYQFFKLKELLNYSYDNSIFYRKHFTSNNFNPNDLKKISDIKKIPMLQKSDLLKNNSTIHTNWLGKKFKAITSGSSGNSLSFQRDESADSFNRAVTQYCYSWYNVHPWHRNGYFWGFNYTFEKKIRTNFLDFLQNRFRVFSYQKSELKIFIKKLSKAVYIHGYSSMIYHVARLINQGDLTKPKGIIFIKGTSEKIYKNYHKEVIKAFGSKIRSEYGATESGIIAFECPAGSMHINMEGVIVEEVNNEIVVTNLQMKSFPIIRYRLGDYIKLASNSIKCNCGRNHRILEEVTGRIGQLVYGKNEIYPSLIFYYIFKNLDLHHSISLNYQIIQKEKGKLFIRIEQQLKQIELKKIDSEFVKYFGQDIQYDIQEKCLLHSGKEKLKSFISHLHYEF